MRDTKTGNLKDSVPSVDPEHFLHFIKIDRPVGNVGILSLHLLKPKSQQSEYFTSNLLTKKLYKPWEDTP